MSRGSGGVEERLTGVWNAVGFVSTNGVDDGLRGRHSRGVVGACFGLVAARAGRPDM